MIVDKHFINNNQLSISRVEIAPFPADKPRTGEGNGGCIYRVPPIGPNVN